MSFTPTNFKIREGKEQSYSAAQIVGIYGYNEATDRMQHIKVSDNQNIQVESMELDFNGFAQVLLDSSAATAVLADSTISAEVDPEGRGGWCFTNSVAGSKYNLYYFNGAEELITLGDVSSVYTKMYIDQRPDISVMPFFNIYTKPTGIGDAGPFFHSRITYEMNASDGVVGIGESMIFYAINEPKKAWSERKLQFTTKSVLGDGLADEEVLYMVVGSNSGATTGGVRHCVNMAGFNSGSGIQRNLNLKTSASTDSTGSATEAKQDTQITELQGISTDTTAISADATAINGKITSGADTTLAAAQQVLTYGEVTNGPGAGELHPLHISQAGDLQVEISGLESTGQEAMAASLPVVIASNQSAVATTNASITSGADFTLTNAQQVGLYGYNGVGWERTSQNVVTDGIQTSTLKVIPDVTTQTISPGAGGTALSNAIDLRGFSRCSIYGNSTNSGDLIDVLISDDDITYYADPSIFITPGFSGDFALSLDANIAVRYIKARQIDSLATAFTLVIKSSRR